MFSHILLASDGSECSAQAAKFAAMLARKFSSQLTLVNVFLPMSYMPPYGELSNVGLDEQYRADFQQNALCVAGRVADGLDVPYQCRKLLGDPAEEIIRAAKTEACDLIVLGSRGLNGLQSVLRGSVADHVTHHAHCPVLVIR